MERDTSPLLDRAGQCFEAPLEQRCHGTVVKVTESGCFFYEYILLYKSIRHYEEAQRYRRLHTVLFGPFGIDRGFVAQKRAVCHGTDELCARHIARR